MLSIIECYHNISTISSKPWNINITLHRHFTLVYLLGIARLPYARERNKNRLYMHLERPPFPTPLTKMCDVSYLLNLGTGVSFCQPNSASRPRSSPWPGCSGYHCQTPRRSQGTRPFFVLLRRLKEQRQPGDDCPRGKVRITVGWFSICFEKY